MFGGCQRIFPVRTVSMRTKPQCSSYSQENLDDQFREAILTRDRRVSIVTRPSLWRLGCKEDGMKAKGSTRANAGKHRRMTDGLG